MKLPARLALLCCLLTVGVVLSRANHPSSAPLTEAEAPLDIPLVLGEWQGHAVPIEEGPTLEEIGVDWRTLRVYQREGLRAELLVEYNRAGNAREHTPDHCVRGHGWLWTSSEDRVLSVPERSALPVTATIMQYEGARVALIYWYQLGQRAFANHLRRKMVSVGRTLVLRPALPKVGVRVIVSGVARDEEQLMKAAEEFAIAAAPYVAPRSSAAFRSPPQA